MKGGGECAVRLQTSLSRAQLQQRMVFGGKTRLKGEEKGSSKRGEGRGEGVVMDKASPVARSVFVFVSESI